MQGSRDRRNMVISSAVQGGRERGENEERGEEGLESRGEVFRSARDDPTWYIS